MKYNLNDDLEVINNYSRQIKEIKKRIYEHHQRKNKAWDWYAPTFKEAPYWKKFIGKKKTKEEFIENVNKSIKEGAKIIKRLILDCAKEIKEDKNEKELDTKN